MRLIARRVALYVVTAIVAITSSSDLLIGFIISAAAGSRNRDNRRIIIKLITRGTPACVHAADSPADRR